MDKIKLFLMHDKPTLHDLAGSEMSKDAKIVFRAAFEDARKEQEKLLKQAKVLSR